MLQGPKQRGAFFDTWLSIFLFTLRRATIKVRHEMDQDPVRSEQQGGPESKEAHCPLRRSKGSLWSVGALCWSDKINTESEREQRSSGLNIQTKDWPLLQITNNLLHGICNKSKSNCANSSKSGARLAH